MVDTTYQRIVLVAVASGAVGIVTWAWLRNRTKFKWELAGSVKELVVYPIKSTRGIVITNAKADFRGIQIDDVRDRSFVVYTEEGVMVTGRISGPLVTLQPTFKDHIMTIIDLQGDHIDVDLNKVEAINKIVEFRMREVDSCGLDCGKEIADWLSKRLFKDQKKVRLYYTGKLDVKRPARKPKYFEFPSFKKTDKLIYADTAPYMINTVESMNDLNNNLKSPVDFRWFRPNIIVEGSKAYDEDNWSHIRIGDNALMRALKPCERCLLTSISPDDGTNQPEAREELIKYRTPGYPSELAKVWAAKPVFGVQCAIDIVGSIKVGDPVYVVRKQPLWKIKTKN